MKTGRTPEHVQETSNRGVIPLGLALLLAALVLAMAVAAAMAVTTSAAGAQAGPTLTITVIDPDGPTETHPFRFINGPAPVNLMHGESASWQFAPENSVNVRAGQVRTNFYSNVECDAGDFTIDVEGTHAVRGPMPYEDVHCTWTAVRAASVTVVSSAPSDTSRTFLYRLIGRGFPIDLRNWTDGDSLTIPVPTDRTLTLDSLDPFGWITTLSCTDDNAEATIPGASTDAELTFSAGTHAVCTFNHVRGYDLTIAVDDPDGPDVEHGFTVNGTSVVVTDAQPADVPVPRLDPVTVDDDGAVAFFSNAFCSHPNLIALQSGSISGDMPGGEVTCTFVVDRTTTAILETHAPDDPSEVFTYQVSSALGTLTIEQSHGDSVSVPIPTNAGVVSVLQSPESSWTLGVGCTGDAGGATIPGVAADVDLSLTRGTTATCTFSNSYAGPSVPFGVFPTVTCLAGNGRIDANVLNGDSVAHSYRLEIGSLAARVRTVDAGDWWRSPVTGRPDGPLQVRILRDGTTIFDQSLTVACDSAPAVSMPEIQLINACRGGLGFVAWQFANPTNQTRSYVIAFDGVPNRSTSAAPYGASVRGVSARPDGTYSYTIRANGAVVLDSTVTVNCT